MVALPSQGSVQGLLDAIVPRLAMVAGIEAVVLGGSRALGAATPASDVDLGLYYRAEAPPDLDALQRVAAEIDDEQRRDAITPLGEWGPWINGGGWLRVQGVAVDFLYRELGQVEQVIDACRAGRVEIFYQPGHPHGFVNAIYMGEVAVCRSLWDAHGALHALKARTDPYPGALQRALIGKFLWEARFSLDTARKSAGRGDAHYVAGCCFRSVACLMQTLFALNRRYLLNEKGAVARAATLPLCPPQLEARVQDIYARLDGEGEHLVLALTHLEELMAAVEALAANSVGTNSVSGAA